MPRRKSVNFVREIGVDPRFQSSLIQKFINVVMERGKKTIAQAIVYDAFDILKEKRGGDDSQAFAVFDRALQQIRPTVEVKSRRVGGGVYQVPTEVRSSRATALAFRWLLTAAASRSDKTMGARLAQELFEASEGRGNAVKKRADVHKMAEANRAFSHYGW
jgi:small subunit ribosomal protein S7